MFTKNILSYCTFYRAIVNVSNKTCALTGRCKNVCFIVRTVSFAFWGSHYCCLISLNSFCTVFFLCQLLQDRMNHKSYSCVLLLYLKMCALFPCSWILRGSLSSSPCFSAVSKTKREQEKLVWSQSLCGSDGRRPVQENWEMQQHPQPQMEAAAHCVSYNLARITRTIWHLITFLMIILNCCVLIWAPTISLIMLN